MLAPPGRPAARCPPRAAPAPSPPRSGGTASPTRTARWPFQATAPAVSPATCPLPWARREREEAQRPGPVQDAVWLQGATDEADCAVLAANATDWSTCTVDGPTRCYDESDVLALWDNATKGCALWLGLHRPSPLLPANASTCSMTLLAVPLRCLWMPEGQCRAPAETECVWGRASPPEDEALSCCLDGTHYVWPKYGTTLRLATSIWVLIVVLSAMCCIGLVVIMKVTDPSRFPVLRPAPDGGREKLNEELIQRHREGYDALLKSLTFDLQPDSTSSSCSVCLEALTDTSCVRLPECGHTFHHDCLHDYIVHQVEKKRRKYPECPNCRSRIPLPPAAAADDGGAAGDEGSAGGDSTYEAPAVADSPRAAGSTAPDAG
eukprot:TRINITY_DN26773_c0_g1_i3.p1 TRINITY_DN26773_c0_g1~~TRINITY_DN26773_c0_g1_i3.p1  ORF type:complete len:378 (+),score=53.69 TRINITY_DN26773_c0_g1_i3:425-1558(+)